MKKVNRCLVAKFTQNCKVKSENRADKYNDYEYDHYKSNNIVEIINEIGNEEHAIQKASKLLDYHKNKKPIEANPSTKVHILVKELRDWIKFYEN